MNVKPAFASGLDGMNVGVQGVARAAGEIARLNVRDEQTGERGITDLGSTAESLVDLKIYTRQFEASVRVVAAADEMLGSLLDELA